MNITVLALRKQLGNVELAQLRLEPIDFAKLFT